MKKLKFFIFIFTIFFIFFLWVGLRNLYLIKHNEADNIIVPIIHIYIAYPSLFISGIFLLTNLFLVHRYFKKRRSTLN